MTRTGHPATRLLSADAHALRNHVATIRSALLLVEDPEAADAIDQASRALQVAIERAIVLSRLELDERPEIVRLPVADLLSFAARRARREGADLTDRSFAPDGVETAVPGPWAERLLADLLHHTGADAECSGAAHDTHVELRLELVDGGIDEPLASALRALAAGCGGELRLAARDATLRLPSAASLSPG